MLHRIGFQPNCVNIENLDMYISNAKKLDYFLSNDNGDDRIQNLILSTEYQNVTYYLIFFHKQNYWAHLDPDQIFDYQNKKFPMDEAIRNIAKDLVRKVMSATVSQSLEELITSVRIKGNLRKLEIYKKLKNKFLSELEDKKIDADITDAYSMQFGDPQPSLTIAKLIKKGQPATLRQILHALDLAVVSVKQEKKLELILEHEKIRVIRSSKNMMAAQYEPAEFACIELLILDWFNKQPISYSRL